MKKVFISILFTIALTGCATTGNYGNFTNAPHQISEHIGQDAAKKIIETYPPANTSFLINHDVLDKDQFGLTLINELRKNGFAIHIKSNQTNDKEENEPINSTLFYYVVDSFDNDFYRVTLTIGSEKFSRAYKGTSPIGVWSKGGI